MLANKPASKCLLRTTITTTTNHSMYQNHNSLIRNSFIVGTTVAPLISASSFFSSSTSSSSAISSASARATPTTATPALANNNLTNIRNAINKIIASATIIAAANFTTAATYTFTTTNTTNNINNNTFSLFCPNDCVCFTNTTTYCYDNNNNYNNNNINSTTTRAAAGATNMSIGISMSNSQRTLNASSIPPDNLVEMDFEMDPDLWPLERVVSTIVPVFFGIIGLAGLLGNALVILVVVANQQMRSTTNLLIINLAVSDILFVIFCVPFTATDYVLPEWPFGNVWCKFVQYMIVVTCHCSVYTLVLMSFDRFLAVVHPVTSMSLRTERNAMFAILLAWILIVTTGIPVALAHSVRIYQYRGHNYTACVFSTEDEGWSLVGFQVSFFLSSYVAPLTLICFLYMGMLARLWKTAPGCKPSAESRKGKRRVTRMVVVVVLAFAICWLPIHVILVLKALNLYGSTHATVIIQIISHVLAYTNSCINPILYAFLSDNFRKAFRKIVWCGSTPLIVANQQMTKTTRTTGNGTSNIDML